MSDTLFKEDLSRAYLRAASAIAEISYEKNERDHDGSDVTLKKLIEIDGNKVWASIDVQLKSTSSSSQYAIDNGYIKYALKGKNYNDLLMKRNTRLLLMLMILPSDKNDWTSFTAEEMILRKCMYWTYVEGSESPVKPESSKTISIPLENLVNPESLDKIIRDKGV